MGVVMTTRSRLVAKADMGQLSPTALEDTWLRQATAAAIAAARNLVKLDGVIPPGTPVGRLSDTEWGWLVAAILFAWIRTRAEQATVEEISTEQAIRLTGYDRNPWDAGAIKAILAELAELKIDWTKPLTEWSSDAMVDFLLEALRLVRKGMIARDLSSGGITRKSGADVIARQTNAAAGGPLMTPDELNDDPHF
jgi:hypothetical protein